MVQDKDGCSCLFVNILHFFEFNFENYHPILEELDRIRFCGLRRIQDEMKDSTHNLLGLVGWS